MQAMARHDVLLISDSDIVVEPQLLSKVVSELQTPGVGGLSCAYFGVAAGGIWAKLSALYFNSQFLPNVVAAVSLDAARPCFGSAILGRRGTLDRIVLLSHTPQTSPCLGKPVSSMIHTLIGTNTWWARPRPPATRLAASLQAARRRACNVTSPTRSQPSTAEWFVPWSISPKLNLCSCLRAMWTQ
jgi:hypothetical protein